MEYGNSNGNILLFIIFVRRTVSECTLDISVSYHIIMLLGIASAALATFQDQTQCDQ